MNQLTHKLKYLQDLSLEHLSSTHSLHTTTQALHSLLALLEKQISARNREKDGFITKVGVALRQHLLVHYNTITHAVHQHYCMAYQLQAHLEQQQQTLQEVISNTQPLLADIQRTTTTGRIQLEKSLKGLSQQQGRSPMKTLRQSQFLKQNKSDNYSANLFIINKKGKESLLETSLRVQNTQIFEINRILDNCINSVGDLSPFYPSQTAQIPQDTRRQTQNIPNEASRQSPYASLGIQSVNGEEIDLLCDQELDSAVSVRVSIESSLQRITQREQEQQSDTPRGFQSALEHSLK